MKDVDDESAHLVVTSQPYPMTETWNPPFRALDRRIDECFRPLIEASIGEARSRLGGEQRFELLPRGSGS